MSLQNIVLHADISERFADRAAVAAALIKNFGVTLTAIHTHMSGAILKAEVATPGQMWNQYKDFLWGEEAKCHELLNELIGNADSDQNWIHPKNHVVETIEEQARFADCVILSQQPSRSSDRRAVVDPGKVVNATCRPCLVVPPGVKQNWVPQRVAIAWNDSAESAKAVRDCLMWLRIATDVHVVTVDGGDVDLSRVQRYLATRGVISRSTHIGPMKAINEGACFNQWAESEQIDLIIMGAYGHRRGYEMVFGGFTDYMLRHSNVPVLMVS